MILDVLKKLTTHGSLSREEARGIIHHLTDGGWSGAQVGGLLVALRLKGETVDELTGMAEGLRDLSLAVEAPPGAVDLCGTGGDGGRTFNVSTVASLIVAAAGVPVAKHGNRAVSGHCGSADVLEGLGVPVTLDATEALECLRRTNFGFFFAPRYHPALGTLSAIRRELGVRTTFNLLGPLVNPANVTRQLVGVFSPQLVMPFAEVLRLLGAEKAMVVHGDGGVDELTTTGSSIAAILERGEIREETVFPQALGLSLASAPEIAGGDRETNVRIATAILGGEPGPHRDISLLNAAGGLFVAGMALNLEEGIEMAAKAIDSGRAWEVLEELRAFEAEALT